MTVASSAVAMAVTTETRTVDVEQEGHVSRQMIVGGTAVAKYEVRPYQFENMVRGRILPTTWVGSCRSTQ